MPLFATEERIWNLGEPDRSDHEFNTAMNIRAHPSVVVQIGTGNEAGQWPHFQPASGNGAFGQHLYRYSLDFNLPAPALRGIFYLDLNLLFRQPRTPALELEVNGQRGRYYFEPEPMFALGAISDEFNPIRSVAGRKIALPASCFRAGKNRITFAGVDDPPVVVTNQNVGGDGDSGFYYDSLALTHDPNATWDAKVQVRLTPSVFYRKTAKSVEEECPLTISFPSEWPGGEARVTIGRFTTQFKVPKPAEFGEARYTMLVPGQEPACTAQIVLSDNLPDHNSAANEHTFAVNFVPARKWKLYYAPHEHMDVGYTDYRAKVAELHARNADQLLNVLEQHPDYRFNFDGGWVMDQWLDWRSPRDIARIEPHVRAGQIAVNGFYDCPATAYPSLEGNIRNLYYGRELQKRFGIPFDFALISDVPSVSWSIPSILASAGIRYFADGGNQDRGPLLASGHWNVRSPFWWEGPDGQRVLAWFSAHYHQLKALCGLPPTIESGRGGVARFLRAYELADYKPDAVLVYGTQVENLPTDYDDAAFVERWNAHFAYPRLITCRFSEFFQYIEKHYGESLPVVRGTGGAYWADNFGILAAATARDRANQTRALSAETLATLTTTTDPNLRFARELDHDIWRNLLLYGEHNFGTGNTATQPARDEVIGVVNEKQNYTLRAAEEIDKWMRHSMSQLADQIQTEGQDLIVFNPLSWQRSGLVGFQLNDGATLTDVATGHPVGYEMLDGTNGYQAIRFWARDVPPAGYKVYHLGHGPTLQSSPAEQTASNVVENRFYRITLDAEHAAIKSIYDKQLERELVDSSSPYLANEYLFVSGGEQSRLLHPFHWLPEPQLVIHPAERGVLIGIEKTPWGPKIRMTASATHTPRISTDILLPDDVKEIEISDHIQVDLLYSKQACYFAFPWAMPKPTFRYDIADGFVNPAKDLLEGGCSDWFAIQSVVNVEDGSASVDLAAVDAPLVCLGDINRGRWAPQFTNHTPVVFSYALNNYWSPKWAGKNSAELSYRYVITSGPPFDPAQAERFGIETRCPLEVAELKKSDKLPGLRGTLPPGKASFASLSPAGLAMTAFKCAEDGQGLVVRILEIAGLEADGILKLPRMTIVSAREANAVETPGKKLEIGQNSVRFHIHPHQILTMKLMVKVKGQI